MFTQNGDTPSPVETDPSRLYVILVTLKEGMTASLSRIVRVFEVSYVILFTCTSETTRIMSLGSVKWIGSKTVLDAV